MKTGNKAGIEGPKGPAAENDADRLVEKVLSAVESGELRQGFTMREVLRKHWAGATADAMAETLNCCIVDGKLELRKVITTGRPRFGYFTPAATLQTHLANADQDRLDALEEAECATEDRDGYRLELAMVRAQVRYLEAALWTARHEHAEMRARLGAAEAKLAAPKRECECACGCTDEATEERGGAWFCRYCYETTVSATSAAYTSQTRHRPA